MVMALSLGTIVDGIIVGNTLGAQSLAAVNLVLPLTLVFTLLNALIGVGGSSLIALAKGRRDADAANQVFTVSIGSTLLLSVFFALAGIFLLEPITRIVSGDHDLKFLVGRYLSVLVYGAPVVILFPVLVYFVRVDGKPELSTAVVILANVVNLICDLVFILGFGMDVQGAALASITGFSVGFLVLFRYFFSADRTLRFVRPSWAAWKTFWEIVTVGTSSALAQALLFVQLFASTRSFWAFRANLGSLRFPSAYPVCPSFPCSSWGPPRR